MKALMRNSIDVNKLQMYQQVRLHTLVEKRVQLTVVIGCPHASSFGLQSYLYQYIRRLHSPLLVRKAVPERCLGGA